MKRSHLMILVISLSYACESPGEKTKGSRERDSIEISYSYENSPVDFVVKDSLGFSLHFMKNIDSSYYHALRYRTPEEQVLFEPSLPNLERLWSEAKTKIDIKLKSINLGYPLQYNDILTRHIEAFSASGIWGSQMINREANVDHRLIEEIMLKNQVYPVSDLLKDFGYKISDINVEKIGFVEPARLVGLGFDESLNIPVPYIVWILVEENH